MAVAASTAGGIHTQQAQNTGCDYQDWVVSGGRKDSEPERVGGKLPARFKNTAVSWKEALCCMIQSKMVSPPPVYCFHSCIILKRLKILSSPSGSY